MCSLVSWNGCLLFEQLLRSTTSTRPTAALQAPGSAQSRSSFLGPLILFHGPLLFHSCFPISLLTP
jgi:hypothetical protein